VSPKRIFHREQARRDGRAAARYYLSEAGEGVALDFADALRDAFNLIGDAPQIGSPRYAHDLGKPCLRSLQLRRYPYLVFYIERRDHVEILRVLHARRDISSLIQGP
jgi:toxin ParE1/3/4